VREEAGGRLVAGWRIADAEWAGVFESGGLREAHWLHLQLDAGAHRVRAMDVRRGIYWSSGVAGLRASIFAFRGITFYEYDRSVQRGLFFRNGRWTTKAYDYRFLLSEMKSPIVDAVTGSGWTFAPALSLSGPISTPT